MKFLVTMLFLACFLCINSLQALVKGDLSQVFSMSQGEERRVKIIISNELEQAQTFIFKQSDYTYNAKGENFFEAPGSKIRSNASWIELSQERISVPPKSEAEYFYKIKVPSSVSKKGSYWSLILIEPENQHRFAVDSQGMNIQVKIRYAYQVITNIGSTPPMAQILGKALDITAENPRLNVDVKNTGETFFNAKVNLLLYDDDGALIHSVETGLEKLVPQSSVRYNLNIGPLKKGLYSGLLLLDCGEEHVFGERVEFNFS